jgi:hypothetical protein
MREFIGEVAQRLEPPAEVPMAQIVAIGYAMLEERTDWNLRLGFASVTPC